MSQAKKMHQYVPRELLRCPLTHIDTVSTQSDISRRVVVTCPTTLTGDDWRAGCDKFQGPEKKMYSTKYSLCTAKDGFIIKTCMKGYTPSANKTSCTKIECVCANGYPSHSCTEPNQEKCQGCKAGFKYEQASGKCTGH